MLDAYRPTQSARKFDFEKVTDYAKMMGPGGAWDWSLGKIIIDSEGHIVSGHHRVLAAEIAGLPAIPESAIFRLNYVTPRPVYEWSVILGGTGILGF